MAPNQKKMNLLTVILLCHNRPVLAREAVKSILNQNEKDFKFIISDNSSNKEMNDLIKNEFASLEYISWFPGVPVFEHFKRVISLVDSQYFVLFHDDDIMEPEFIKTILDQFESNPTAAAIGTNAFLMTSAGQSSEEKYAFSSRNRTESFYDRRNFVVRYLASDLGGISPFCSYAYNTELVQGLYPDYSKARNYCDTIFLTDVLKRGPIIWVNKPLVRVRCHDDNLSTSSGVGDYKGFLSFIRMEYGPVFKQRYVDEYRLSRLIVAIRRRGRKIPLSVIKYSICVLPKLMICSNSFRSRVLKKLLRLGS
jgi:glycosyltransferase involved in cell wall biosynthesis